MSEEGGVKTKAPQRRDLVQEDVNRKLRELNASFAENVSVGTFHGMARPRELTLQATALKGAARRELTEVAAPKSETVMPKTEAPAARVSVESNEIERSRGEAVRESVERSRSVLSVVANGISDMYDTIHDGFIGAAERLNRITISDTQEKAVAMAAGTVIVASGLIMLVTGNLAQSSWLQTPAVMNIGTADTLLGSAVLIYSGLVG